MRVWLGLACALLATVWLSGAGQAAPERAEQRLIVLGIDGMDPELLQQFMDEGILPKLSRLAAQGSFIPLDTSIPPQSPVAWSNFVTGMNPGGHGIFDFMHRDPATYAPVSSATRAPERQAARSICSGTCSPSRAPIRRTIGAERPGGMR